MTTESLDGELCTYRIRAALCVLFKEDRSRYIDVEPYIESRLRELGIPLNLLSFAVALDGTLCQSPQQCDLVQRVCARYSKEFRDFVQEYGGHLLECLLSKGKKLSSSVRYLITQYDICDAQLNRVTNGGLSCLLKDVVSAMSKGGGSVLEYLELLRMLIRRGADPNFPYSGGMTPFVYSCRAGVKEAFLEMLDRVDFATHGALALECCLLGGGENVFKEMATILRARGCVSGLELQVALESGDDQACRFLDELPPNYFGDKFFLPLISEGNESYDLISFFVLKRVRWTCDVARTFSRLLEACGVRLLQPGSDGKSPAANILDIVLYDPRSQVQFFYALVAFIKSQMQDTALSAEHHDALLRLACDIVASGRMDLFQVFASDLSLDFSDGRILFCTQNLETFRCALGLVSSSLGGSSQDRECDRRLPLDLAKLVDSFRKGGLPLYLYAAQQGWLEVMQELEKIGCNVEVCGEKGFTAFHVAVQAVHPRVVRHLLYTVGGNISDKMIVWALGTLETLKLNENSVKGKHREELVTLIKGYRAQGTALQDPIPTPVCSSDLTPAPPN